jgi:hypothetical protein
MKNRKLWVGGIALGALLLGYAASSLWPAARDGFPTFTTGIVSLAGLYFAGNVGAKFSGRTAGE